MNRPSYTLLLIAAPLLGFACGEVKGSTPDGGLDAAEVADAAAIDADVPDAPPGNVVDADIPDAPPAEEHNLVFVTSSSSSGAFGGRDAADATCNTLAHRAGHDGNFRAYLSTTTESALARIQNARGWVRPDGQPVADTAQSLATKGPFALIRLDENGAVVPAPITVWTATRQGAYYAAYGSCTDWTQETVPGSSPQVAVNAAAGSAIMGGAAFQFLTNSTCVTQARMYCFQIDHQLPVTPPAAPSHKLAFVTTATFSPDDGLAAADTLCNKEATDHHKTGHFRAALATNGASVASRFLPSDGPWKRDDGMPLTSDGVSLFDEGQDLLAPLNVDLAGTHYGVEQVWLGASSLSETPASNATTCADWSSTTATGGRGRAIGQVARGYVNTPCNADRRLLCLQTAAQ